MKKLILASILSAATLTAVAAPETYNVDPSHTFASFEINHLGYSTQRGAFQKTAGTITLDSEKKTGSADITIDTASLNTGWEARDKHLKSEDFFNVAKFPSITFKGKTFKFDGDKLASVSGDFTLLGVTKPLTLNVVNFKCAPHPMSKKPACGADAVATIKRSDFGMAAYVPAVSDEVTLRIQVEASK
ncbi:polyisoprenoid-binding protein [Chitinibacter bivalviorum]|uniref:Polyisoprenoid-binding protein n=1 Tax=Chitinibacter bivalviorum TaxID=2739434 RepID=A0A7H9BI93_9NEIS|nr:YceI family protein [Chitinibacter bivalviorum]QLG88259.1 polyisoprenoid-binding protein [Chitinibacter bivalviorum]